MKLAVICEALLESGGGFNQAISAALQIERIAGDYVAYFVVAHEQTRVTLAEYTDREIKLFRKSRWDSVVKFANRFDSAGDLSKRKRKPLKTKLERMLTEDEIDLAYFVTPSAYPLYFHELNYVYTVWDVCHRDSPEFPEVRENGAAKWRDYQLRNALPRAVLTLVDAPETRDKLALQFGVSDERLLPMPFSTASHLQYADVSSRPVDGYFYYPAQFWAHKNHIRIFEALQSLGVQGIRPKVVFSGGDKGVLGHLRETAKQFGLEPQVTFAGFVQQHEMVRLYEGCAAVLMPSYFGPTNLPPLEAWTLKRPLVCSNVMSEQVADAALIFDPDRADALAQAMIEVLKKDVADKLIERGTARLRDLEALRTAAEGTFVSKLRGFDARQRCWL